MRMRSTPAGRLYSHLASKQDATGPGQSPAQDVFFLTFGVTGKAPDKCICPLGKVLTYKNLIYLLNFPIMFESMCSYIVILQIQNLKEAGDTFPLLTTDGELLGKVEILH